ncbi:MAG: CbiX/SirB N-terminal domain-containing protein [Paraclostridium sp.]
MYLFNIDIQSNYTSYILVMQTILYNGVDLMIISMLCWLSIGLSLIFNGYIENILIIIATILAYTYFSESKDYKNILIGLIISFAIINLSIIFFIKDSIKPKSIELGEVQKDTLVVLVYDGEDRNYNVRERANEMYYEQGYKSYFNSIYSLYKHKSYYEKLGSSDFKDTTYDIESRLRDKLGDDYKVISTYMYTKPYFENYIQESAALGYKDIIICPMFITEGKDFKNFKERLEKLELSKYGLNIRLTEVLYKSSNLAKAYAYEIVNDINNKEIDAPYKSSNLFDISLKFGYFSLPFVIIVGINAFFVASFLSKTLCMYTLTKFVLNLLACIRVTFILFTKLIFLILDILTSYCFINDICV